MLHSGKASGSTVVAVVASESASQPFSETDRSGLARTWASDWYWWDCWEWVVGGSDHSTKKDQGVAFLERAGLPGDRIEHHLIAALDADQETRTFVLSVPEEHHRHLDEVTPDQVRRHVVEIHLVGVAVDCQQLLVDSRYSMIESRSREES